MDGKDGRPQSPNAWAPEYTYVPEDDLFYIYWSSRVDDRQLHYVTTTRDWITFTTPRPLFDPGFTAIDLTVVRQGDTFHGYYKDERNGEKTILYATTRSLDPAVDTFHDKGRILPADHRSRRPHRIPENRRQRLHRLLRQIQRRRRPLLHRVHRP